MYIHRKNIILERYLGSAEWLENIGISTERDMSNEPIYDANKNLARITVKNKRPVLSS